jgi:hypothetical protein
LGVAAAKTVREEISMTTVTIELPDDVYSALRRSPEEVIWEMRLAAAVKW